MDKKRVFDNIYKSSNKKHISTFLNYFIPLITPFLCFLITEYTWRINKRGGLYDHPFVSMSPTVIILNILLFYGVWLILSAAIGGTKISSCILLGLSYLIGLANFYIIAFRLAPITAADFGSLRTAMTVSENYFFFPHYRVIVIGIFMLGCIGLNIIFGFKIPSFKKWYGKVLVRVVPIIVGAAIIGSITSLVSREDIKEIIPEFNTTLFTEAIMSNEDGLLGAFLTTIHYNQIKKPDGYSNEKAESILNKYKDDSVWNNDPISKTDKDSACFKVTTDKADIIVVMNECFSDIGVLGDLKTNMDYMPFTHGLMKGAKNTISGYFYSSVIAGSTANTEFEFLTGNTMAFLPKGSIPYQQFVKKKMESMATICKAQNYYTIASHPYVSFGWMRNKVYPLLGFDSSRFQGDMSELSYVRLFASDQSFYNYLKASVFPQSNHYFSFNVTVQNHGGYMGNFDNFKPNVKMTNGNNLATNNYLSLIKRSDDAFKDLINHVKTFKKPTIVVMFGDHQPNDYTVWDVYDYSTEENPHAKGKQNFIRYKVPVIMWANYDIPECDTLLTSANFLSGIVTKLAGLKTSPYQNFLETLRCDVPAICTQGVVDRNGEYRDLENASELSGLINDYKILNYYRTKN